MTWEQLNKMLDDNLVINKGKVCLKMYILSSGNVPVECGEPMLRGAVQRLDTSLTSKISSKCVVLLSSEICLLRTKFCRKSHRKFCLTNSLVGGS